MTQAFNLAQLANNLNTSGQLDATDGLIGLIANANLASSGSPSSTTYLRGDRTWASITQKILQVVSATYSTQASTSSTTYQDTGLTANITPSSNTSKILVLANNIVYATRTPSEAGTKTQLVRNSTAIQIAGSAFYGYANYGGVVGFGGLISMSWLDSPATTSSVTYKMQYALNTATNATAYAQYGNSDASIILLEVEA